jgi:dihydrodipicolinate synthase/N-acetylneuraminate lyase
LLVQWAFIAKPSPWSAPNILGLDRLSLYVIMTATEEYPSALLGKMRHWQGIFPAVTTKFTSRDQIDVAEMERCIALQVDAGVHGLVLAGSLGEGSSLDMIEKTEILKTALRVAGGKIPILMTVSNASTREACLFAEASARNGADGLMVLPGIPYRSDPQETEAHFRAVAQAGGIPIMICNNANDSGVDMTPEFLARLADEPLFRAVKEASGDLRRITRIINLTGDRYRLFAGTEPLALEGLIMGAGGWVAGLVAAFPRETVAIYRYAINGHLAEARRIYRWFRPLLELSDSPKHVQNIKLVEFMVNGSSDRCRLPRQALSGEERSRVEKLLRYALASRASLIMHPPAAE